MTLNGRTIPPPHADERAMLESWLDFHRETLAMKCAGLDDSQLRTAAVAPSKMTLLGLIQHLANVERNWFQRIFACQDIPPVYEGDGFEPVPGLGIDVALKTWRAEVERGRELIAEAKLEDSGDLPGHEAAFLGDNKVSLRWILVHMIEEYARHNGHADLIRESIDGTTGT